MIKYSLQGKGYWLNVTSNTILVREKTLSGLNMYTEYDIRVAGITSVGVGVFSSIFTQRTLEDGKGLDTKFWCYIFQRAWLTNKGLDERKGLSLYLIIHFMFLYFLHVNTMSSNSSIA